MLERGKSVSDVLWYLGDEISHKPTQKYPFPTGYKYYYCNPDVLLNRLSVKDGCVVTPEGQSYRFIWIPENKRMLPETLERLYALMKDGAFVVASPPKGIATLSGGKAAKRRFEKAVRAIWGKCDAGKLKRVGKGAVLSGVSIEQALETLNIPADVKGEGVRWVHRHIQGADCYFVTPLQEKSFEGCVQFRATGSVELWNPVSGKMTVVNGKSENGYTTVELSLLRGG